MDATDATALCRRVTLSIGAMEDTPRPLGLIN